MISKSRKFGLKFTIEFSVLFLILLASVSYYIIKVYETDAYEKYSYKSTEFSNFLKQNPEAFKQTQKTDKEILNKLANLNEALYLVVEGSDGQIKNAINIKVAERNLYSRVQQPSDITKSNPIIKVSFTVIEGDFT